MNFKITVLELLTNCDPEMWVNLTHDYTEKETIAQVKDILKKESEWLGMEVVNKIHLFYTYIVNDSVTSQPVPVLSLRYY